MNGIELRRVIGCAMVSLSLLMVGATAPAGAQGAGDPNYQTQANQNDDGGDQDWGWIGLLGLAGLLGLRRRDRVDRVDRDRMDNTRTTRP